MQWFFVIAGFVAVVYYVRRRLDYGKPKECEATLTRKTVSSVGGAPVYTFTCECGDGVSRVLSTREEYYGRLKEGMRGMLAYRGRTLLDFEKFSRY